jgi:hypothetical protein
MATVLPLFTFASGIPFLQDHTSPVFANKLHVRPLTDLQLVFKAIAHHVGVQTTSVQKVSLTYYTHNLG